MYDELVKSLLEMSKMGMKYGMAVVIMQEAADAIEELSKQLLEMGQVGKFLLDVHKINSKMVSPESVPTDSEWWSHYKALLEVLYLPRWIPVTERLPGKNQIVVVVQRGKTWEYWKFRGLAYLDGNIHKWNWKNNTIKTVDYWMPKKSALPEPPKEGE